MAIEYNAHIVQDGLVLCLDAASKASYPGTGTLWNDLAGSSNGTLINDATFSGANEGVIVFDGTDDYVDCGDNAGVEFSSGESFTLSICSINPLISSSLELTGVPAYFELFSTIDE